MLKKINFWFKRYTSPESPEEFFSTADREFYWLCHVILCFSVLIAVPAATGIGFLGIVFGPLLAWLYGGVWVFIGGGMFALSLLAWIWLLSRRP